MGEQVCPTGLRLQQRSATRRHVQLPGWAHVGSLIGHCYGYAYTVGGAPPRAQPLFSLRAQGPCRPVISSSDIVRIGRATFAKKVPVQRTRFLRGGD